MDKKLPGYKARVIFMGSHSFKGGGAVLAITILWYN